MAANLVGNLSHEKNCALQHKTPSRLHCAGRFVSIRHGLCRCIFWSMTMSVFEKLGTLDIHVTRTSNVEIKSEAA